MQVLSITQFKLVVGWSGVCLSRNIFTAKLSLLVTEFRFFSALFYVLVQCFVYVTSCSWDNAVAVLVLSNFLLYSISSEIPLLCNTPPAHCSVVRVIAVEWCGGLSEFTNDNVCILSCSQHSRLRSHDACLYIVLLAIAASCLSRYIKYQRSFPERTLKGYLIQTMIQ